MTKLRHGSPEEAGMRAERVALARDLCARWVKEGKTPALSVCVARRGVIVLHEAFGRLRPEEDAPPLARESIYPISSATKPITATLAMQLVEEGLVGLNRPVQEYLPEIQSEGAEEMLVHHLLTHTSGYVFDTEEPMVRHVLEKLAGGFEFPPCPENRHPLIHEMSHLICDAPLAVRPGEEMIYSNVNYEFLAEVVRRVSGRPIEDLARERIFEPLGMDDSWYVLPAAEDARVVKRPPEVAGEVAGNRYFEGYNSRQLQETPFGGLGVFSTPLDLATFDQMFLNRGSYGDARILSPASVAAMTRNQIPGIPARLVEFVAPEGSWGYGWTVESPVKWLGYNGSLWPLGTCSHGGFGGTVHWIDWEHEIVAAYCEVAEANFGTVEMNWCADLFQNAITAAVAD